MAEIPNASTQWESGDPESRPTVMQCALPIYVALVLAIVTLFFLLALWRLQHVLLLLFLAVLLASAISRPAARLEQLRIPRSIAALLIYLAAFGIVAAIGWFVIPSLVGQIASLAGESSEYADRYDEIRDRYEEFRAEHPDLGLASFDDQVGGFRGRVIDTVGERLINLPSRTFAIMLDVLAVFVISVLVLTTKEKLLTLILSMVHPTHRELTSRVLVKMWQRIGFYLRAKLIVMGIVAVLTYLALLLIGVPFPVLLAILTALGELIPRIGPWLARIPLLGIAALDGWQTLVLTFIASVIIQNAKGLVISPLVEGGQLDIHPLLVFISVLVGAALIGPAGAFIAVPFAAMVQVLFEEVIIPWRRRQLLAFETPASRSEPGVTARRQDE